ncbi:hypothetical protein [Chryseobacterium paridis]|uniref:Uncharacterized protein n=1 Tax=Chryseobacterium paridis TaxID=2800328 RepID=A0ABS1FXR8_9FLAO|nr:hypothetical protein [Chryseobacterium paridis]MBK1897204.1 hypothetical protein [Chryseobacterium paridis]
MKEKQVKQQEDLSQIRAILQRITIDERFQWGSQTFVQDQEYDLNLIKKDVDFNLKDDLTYIDRLRQNYNSPVTDIKDQEMLEAELNRMEKMYNYKINYLTIMSHLKDMEDKPKIELAKLEKRYSDEIRQLEYERSQPMHFRQRTHEGYKRKIIRKSERSYDQKIKKTKTNLEEEKKETTTRIKQEEKDLIKEVTRFLNIDERYIPLIKSGTMLLPSDSRLAAIFPKNQWLTFNSSNKINRHKIMHRHARKLLLNNNLFTGKSKDRTGILPSSRKGCICIMYIKEGHMKDKSGATFRPVFGASDITPYGTQSLQKTEIERNSYTSMGVPNPMDISDISYEKTAESLRKHVDIMQRLGIKPPSMQSGLYFLQTPEYRANKKISEMQQPKIIKNRPINQITQNVIDIESQRAEDQLICQAKQNKIGMLESWMPSNCAEPAIMTAIYQMYSRPADIYLSVPFEGYLSEGKLLLKYTCTRCALSEPAFMSPDDSSYGQRLTDMRLQSNRSSLVSDHILSAGLIYNHDKKKIKDKEKQAHPYSNKSDAITRTVLRNQGHGFGHVKRGHEQVAMDITIRLMISQSIKEATEDYILQ